MPARSHLTRTVTVAAAGVGVLWLWAELIDWRASHGWLGRAVPPGARRRQWTLRPAAQVRRSVRRHEGQVGQSAARSEGHTGQVPQSAPPREGQVPQPAPTREVGQPAPRHTGRVPQSPPRHEGQVPQPAPQHTEHVQLPALDAVVVLGYGNRGERANFVNRFRVRAGIRSLDPTTQNVLVLCGGTVHSTTPEAVIMQSYARALGFTGPIVLDETSRSTWENIANAIPHIEHAGTIKIVSNAPHAEMGREILWRQRPDLASRLVRGREHRFGEAPLLKILGALRTVQSKLSGAWQRSARHSR